GDAGKAGASAGAATGSSPATTGGGTPGERRDYLAQVQAWLERHKEYPRSARMRRQEGTVLLQFVLDRSGRVLSHRIVRGSGHDALDAEVDAMIRRASPLPPMPPAMTAQTMDITVPVQFALR
ncbi:MAG: energy transducer TonB, partial [Caenispirillum sp.]|nr:energy transducer TonB [Caenispirillum sp.]